MLDFRLDEEQQMLADTVHRFAEEKMRKEFREAEELGKIPDDVVKAGWEIGLLPTGLPEEYGGFGEYSAVTNAIAMEEFSWGDFATTLRILGPNLVAMPVYLSGTDEQKAHYLPMFCDEAMPKVTAALTEKAIQFDPRNLKSTAVLDGDSYLLNGAKTLVPLAKDAELILVYANENGETQAFLVPAGSEGLEIGAKGKWMGINALPTYEVKLNDVRVSAANKLGGDAGIDFTQILNHSRIALGAAAVGLMRAGFEYARDYAKQRVQFGQPVAQYQSIAFMLAEMAIDVDEARLLVWEAAWMMDQGQDATAETTRMKFYLDDISVKVADQALQTLGGYGYIREYPVELWLRNARGLTHFDGIAMI